MKSFWVFSAAMLFMSLGCTSLPPHCSHHPERIARDGDGASFRSENGQEGEPKKEEKQPKTLFEWKVGKKEDEKEEEKGGPDGQKKDAGKNHANGNQRNGRNGGAGEEPEEEKRLSADRPHFPEAPNTVGQGRAILEAGYTFTRNQINGSRTDSHAYPEALLRVGLFADWFEFRISQNFANLAQSEFGVRTTENGPQDLVIGCKLGLTEQKGIFPESAVILQTSVPTGSRGQTANEVLPGVRYNFGWDILKDRFEMEGVLAVAGAQDDVGHTYTQMAAGLTAVITLTKNLESFIEWYGLFPSGAVGPSTGPENYAHGGFVYYVSKNLFFDVHAAVGLNEHAADYYLGSGFAWQY